MIEVNELYMRRALELARHGLGFTSPNPMVGAVIVDGSGRIVGEGYHRRCGEAHAEVNAVNAVADRSVLADSTIYVTLEPCAHWGKTPPCAQLIIDSGIRRVVVGAIDPFAKVSGRGIEMMRRAGIEVVTGVLAEESLRLNAMFITAHTHRRPFVTLKWARSADGFMDHVRSDADTPAARFSTPLTSVLTHRLRSLHDAILVGSGTVMADRPRLDTRLWPAGRAPQPVVADRRRRLDADSVTTTLRPLMIDSRGSVTDLLADLYGRGITSLLVEGGAQMLRAFIDAGVWDVARVETSPACLGQTGAVPAPELHAEPVATFDMSPNSLRIYSQNALVDVKNL